ncbi:MAG: tetratricopeptide repeat protein [Candidatus Limnocylindria bacterium]
MSEALYERYKEALRRGHSASLRGRFDEAIGAYAEAASIAPDRAMPQASLAGVLARTGRITEALAAYDVALSRAPEDEAALRGRAEMLAITGRRAEAAETLDRLAAVLDRDGRLLEATDAARRALELAESRGRREGVEALAARLQEAGIDPASEALGRALGTLVGPATAGSGAAGGTLGGGVSARSTEPKRDPRRSVMSAAAVMTAAAETAFDAGDPDESRRCYLEAAAAQRSIGNLHAAMDMCYHALAVSPADGDVHLSLTELYLDRGWRAAAADKLVLLGRLAELAGDDLTHARLCAMAVDRFPDDTRLAALCS